jgi:hypothetical protein
MQKSDVLAVLRTLAAGIDPREGRYFPVDRNTTIALAYAIGVLEHCTGHPPRELHSRRSPLPANTGKPWTEDEDTLLIAEYHLHQPLAEIAAKHKRTELSIQKRLEKNGIVTPHDDQDEHTQQTQ